jgi:transcriptional regulator with XRE-family HTH domain
MAHSNKPQPFISFGVALKQLREKTSKSQAEVSGAVEIDQRILISYETGEARPPEDILFLLIQHFNLKNNEAQELWRLAGYNKNVIDETEYFINDEIGKAKQVHTVSVSQDDAKIVYTDMIQVMVNNYGVILNFLQGAGINDQPLAVARVGMSKEHARSIIAVLNKTLEQADDIDLQKNNQIKRKQLPPGSKNQD